VIAKPRNIIAERSLDKSMPIVEEGALAGAASEIVH
jgi:hypothetical protein